MQLRKLSGWQRLWILTSMIWLILVTIFAVNTFPTMENTSIGGDEILKNLSTKTLEILIKEGPAAGKASNIRDVQILSNGQEFSVAAGTSQADIDYVRDDYAKVEDRIVNKKRIIHIGRMAMVWIIPCLALYAFGLAIKWVYKGFRKGND